MRRKTRNREVVCTNLRIEANSNRAYRRDAIERAAGFHSRKKPKVEESACDDVPKFGETARKVLERDDHTRQ
ncbi:DUF7692 domain-containing protein [Natrinema caseinilyticum]|uniref:DUF7692 domain-containing protein n=1 Tax=Natrinema caseinilyticum TaxID=2961570 RepID=UPI003CCCE473